jgi:hypothetical protein
MLHLIVLVILTTYFIGAFSTPQARFSHSSFILGDAQLISVGGITQDPTPAFNTGADAILSLDLSASFATTDAPWKPIPIAPASPTPGFEAFISIPIPNRPDALLNGGSLPLPTQNATYLLSINGDVATFVPGNAADMGPQPQRRGHAAAVSGNTAYVFGGIALGGDQELADVTQSPIMNDLWMYDTTTLKWSPVNVTSDKPPARYGHTLTAVNSDTLVLIGGLTRPDVANMQEIWVFHPRSNTWELKKAGGDIPLGRRWHSATLKDASIIVYGGSSADQKTDMAQVAVLDTNTWTWSLPKVNAHDIKGRRSHTAHLVQGQLVVVFGYADETKQPIAPSLLVLDTDKWYYSSWMNPSAEIAAQEAAAVAEATKKNVLGASFIAAVAGVAILLAMVTAGVVVFRRRRRLQKQQQPDYQDRTALMAEYGVRVPSKVVLRENSHHLDVTQSVTERKSKAGFLWFEEGKGGKSGAKVRKLLGVEQQP